MPKDSAMIPTDRTEAIHNLARCPRGISPPFQPSRSRIPKTPFLMSDSTGFISTSEPKQWQDSSSLRAMRHIRNEEKTTSTSAVVQFVGFLRHPLTSPSPNIASKAMSSLAAKEQTSNEANPKEKT